MLDSNIIQTARQLHRQKRAPCLSRIERLIRFQDLIGDQGLSSTQTAAAAVSSDASAPGTASTGPASTECPHARLLPAFRYGNRSVSLWAAGSAILQLSLSQRFRSLIQMSRNL